jgi:hypothetical protein
MIKGSTSSYKNVSMRKNNWTTGYFNGEKFVLVPMYIIPHDDELKTGLSDTVEL